MSHPNIWKVVVSVAAAALLVGGGVYLLRGLNQAQPAVVGNNWHTYQNNSLDVTFQYPLSWQPIDGSTSLSEGLFKLEFKPAELKRDSDGRFHAVGINRRAYVNEGDPGWYGYCAVQYKNIADFCEEGCEKISDKVAIDYRRVYHGERGFSAMAYTDLSAKYPSICFELDLVPIFNELGGPAGVGVGATTDIKALIKAKKVSAPIMQAVENFERFARSIERK